jgi:hypothetical protein
MEIDLNEMAEGAVLLDGLETAIIGIIEEFGNGPRVLYSKDIIIDILCRRDEMTEEEAEEFYGFNILGLHAGEQNAVFLTTKLLSFRSPEDKMEYHKL